VLQVNFAFVLMKTMRFYGWTWQQAMATPIFAFWTCYAYVDRLAAQEMLDRLSINGFEHMEAQSRQQFITSLTERVGTVTVDKPVFDAEGWRSLKSIS
jgi:hypothetical protein